MSKGKILVVDDEPDILDTVRRVLEMEEYEVITAVNGLEGLGAARMHKPDLILLDVMLPGENGYRVARAIREDEEKGVYAKPIPIVLVTARDLSADPEREHMFMDFSRANHVLYKPFEFDDLLDLVRSLMSGSG
jgi:CheY-like chemotaxis protein